MLSQQAKDIIKMLFASKNTEEEKDIPQEVIATRLGLDERLGQSPVAENVRVTPLSHPDVDGEFHQYTGSDRVDGHVLMLLHGGGFMTGSVISRRAPFSGIVQAARMDALAVTYTQWPEGTHPAALIDSLRAYEYLLQQGYQAEKIHLFGESAGAVLALTTVLTLKDQGKPLPGSVCIFSPVAGPGEPLLSHTERADRDPMIVYRKGIPYYGNTDQKDFKLAPRYGDYRGFPKIQIHVGSEEVLYDDAMLIRDLCKEAGVDVRLKEWEGLFHCFLLFPCPEAKDAFHEIGQFFLEGTAS